MSENREIRIIDVTNRDAVRSSRLSLSKLQKTMINIYLNELGVYESEIGFPATKHEINYINANYKLKDRGLLQPLVLGGWINAMRSEVEEVLKHTKKIEHLYMSVPSYTPLIKSRYGIDWNFEKVLDEACFAIEKAKKNGIKTISVGGSDSTRCSEEELLKIVKKARDAGAHRFRYCDTWGFDTPQSIYSRVKMIAQEVKLPIEIHCHNDMNLAVANTVEGARGAVDGGVESYVTTTVNGIGERAGNADLLSVILVLTKGKFFREKNLLEDRINLTKLRKLATYTSYAFGVPISPTQVGVGENAFIHTLGVHIDGAVREIQDFEVYSVEELGKAEPEIIETGRWVTTGAYGGIKGFRNIYGKLEIEFKNDEEASKVLNLIRFANVHNQLPLTNDELRFLAKYPDIAKEILVMQY